MSDTPKLAFFCFLMIVLSAISAAAQSSDPEEIKRRIELIKLQNELTKQETEQAILQIGLEKRKQELARLRAGEPAGTSNVTPIHGSNNQPPATGPSGLDPSSTGQSREAVILNPGTGTVVRPTAPSGTNGSAGTIQPGSSGTTPPASPAPAQSDICVAQALDPAIVTRYKSAVCQIIRRADAAGEISARQTVNQFAELLAAKILPSAVTRSFFFDAEKKRTDKQVGAAPNSAGTTGLVVKGGTPALLGWAVEQGAATSSVSGNTVTMRLNPFNLAKALFLRQGLLEIRDINPRDDAFDKFLRNISVGLSFDTSRGVETPTFTGTSGQVSAFSVRYEFINHRNPLSPRHKAARDKFFFDQTANLDKVARAMSSIFDRNTGEFKSELMRDWLAETNAMLSAIPPTVTGAERTAQRAAIIETQVEKIPYDELAKIPDLKAAIESFADGSMGFKEGRDDLLEEINDGQVATFEYTNNREPIAPDTSNFRFIWEKGIFRKTDFTFNSSLTVYNKEPMSLGVKRIRDFQFAIQTDTKIGGGFGGGDMLLSFAGRYERLNGDTINALGVVTPGTEGDIALGQIKLTIPIADWGIKLPLSVTFANRTELIKESNVRANFGFTFDLDPIFARLKPFTRW